MSFRTQNRAKTPKIRSSPKIKEFLSPKSSEIPPQKKSSPQFGTKFGRNLWDLFVLTGPFLSDQPALKSRWRDNNSRWGMRPSHPLNNLSTDCNHRCSH